MREMDNPFGWEPFKDLWGLWWSDFNILGKIFFLPWILVVSPIMLLYGVLWYLADRFLMK